MKTNGSNANQLATNPKEKKGTLGEWLNERKDSLNNALPANTVNVDRFMQSAFLAITNPKMPDLVRCSKDSIFRALREAAAYGLELSGMLGQAYLIPYNEKGVMTAHLQLGYKGLIALARRSNTIKTIAAEAIHENDIFDCELASGRSIHHKIDIFKERGEVVAYYCLVELANGGEQFKVMSKKEIEKHRDKFSKAYNPKDPNNIWNKNFDAMALKTCVIQALKLCPISIEAMDAVAKEEKDDIKDFSEQVEYTISDEVPETKEETPAVEDKKQQKKEEPVQEQSSFDEANGITDEEMAAAEEAFESAPQNVNDIF
ncbi:MAG: recombinase RecT [Methanobrevibacter sp.]|nr:recombinase RecT [Methanobrevibacter sp.]